MFYIIVYLGSASDQNQVVGDNDAPGPSGIASNDPSENKVSKGYPH